MLNIFVKIAYWLIHTFMLVVFFFLILSVLYFFHGSFEMSPTEEQKEKVYIATSLMIIFFILLEMVLFGIWRVLKNFIQTRKSVQSIAEKEK